MPIFVGAGSTFDSKVSGGGKGVSIGTTNTAGRNAGVGTATGTMVYNTTTSNFEGYTGTEWTNITETFVSTGGTKIESGNNIYHIFTSSGSLVISADAPNRRMEFIVVGAGGAGRAGGGGGGGIFHAPAAPVVAATMPVTVGPGPSPGDGADSAFAHPLGTATGYGGGTGGNGGNTNNAVGSGGASGGVGFDGGAHPGGGNEQPGHPATPYPRNLYGGIGGGAPQTAPYQASGGGGGAGGNGSNGQRQNVDGDTSTGGPGGAGQPFPSFPTTIIGPALASPTLPVVGGTGLFGGGGGGGSNTNAGTTPNPSGGSGGGGDGTGVDGTNGYNANSYGGGGGGWEAESPRVAATGYQGIVCVRIYPV